MAEFILKNSKGKEQTFNQDKIFVQGTDGKLVQFTEGTGSSADVRYVTFMSHNGLTEYGKKAVAVGDDCADPITRGIFGTPTRESTPQYDFDHDGWSDEPNGSTNANWNKAIMENKTVYATFKSSTRYYTASYYDGEELVGTEQIPYRGSGTFEAPLKDGYFFDTWEPKPVNITGDISCYAKYKEHIDFATATWAEIAAVSERGDARVYFAIGDTKQFTHTTSTGTTSKLTARIIGFDHDDLSDGSGKAGITCIVEKPIPSTTSKWSSYNYGVPYNNSTVHSNLNGTILSQFEETLRNVIKQVNKKADKTTAYYTSSPDLIDVPAKLWIPDMVENGDTTITNNGFKSILGTKYEGAIAIGDILPTNGQSCFTRTINRGAQSVPNYYYRSGGILRSGYSDNQTKARNLVVGFCI